MERIKGYFVLGVDKDGKYYGYVEHSFSMGVSDTHVKVHTKRKLPKNYYEDYDKGKETTYNGLKLKVNSYNQYLYITEKILADRLNRQNYNNCKWRAYRVNSKNCPIKIDFTEFKLMNQKKMKYDKWLYRNQPFTVK